MKTNASLLRHFATAALLLLPLTVPRTLAQTTTTAPVGFVTVSISGGGAQGAPVYTFTSLGIVNPIAWQSVTTTSTAGATTLTDTSATWTDNLYNSTTTGAPPTYFVEILSGTSAGTMYDIVTTAGSTQTLTLATPLASGVTAGVGYAIRPHWTIASVFGAANQGGLQGGNSTTADQVQLWRNGGFVTYYYQTSGFGGTGWRLFGAPTVDASANVIYPNDGIVIARQQSAGVSLVLSGAVKTGQTSIPVLGAGYTLLGNVYSAGMTLSTANLYTGNPSTGLAGGSTVTADQVLFWNGTGFATYYYQTSGFGGTGWRLFGVPTVDASATVIPVGAALFVNRSGAAFNWVAPQFPSTF
jgi:uncharacterized protein (TIGR02597 family)